MWGEIRRATRLRPAPHRQYAPMPAPGAETRPGLYAGEPETCRRSLLHFLPIAAHLGLLLAVFKVFRIEGRAFQMLVTFALVALPVHYWLPFRWKKPCFVAVSIAGLAWIFGTATAGFVLALAALLIGVCYLPLAWEARAAVLAAIAVGLATVRLESVTTGIPDNVWPRSEGSFTCSSSIIAAAPAASSRS